MKDTGGDIGILPGELLPVATEEQLADQLRAVTEANAVVSGRPQSVLDRLKAETGIPKSDLTLTTLQNDPLNVGKSELDHRKAQWAALLWKHAVADRCDDEIHTRGVHYVTLSTDFTIPSPNPEDTDWDVYANTTTCYAYLSSALSAARVLGYVPENGIIDEKNSRYVYQTTVVGVSQPANDALHGPPLGKPPGFSALSLPSRPTFNPKAYRMWGEAATSAGEEYEKEFDDLAVDWAVEKLMADVSISVEGLQPYHIEVWSEKTLPAEVKTTAQDAGCGTVIEGEGCMSDTQVYDFGERLQRIGKPAVMLYLSDYDPAGSKMPIQVASKLEWLKQNPRIDLEHEVYLEPLALTAEQVERHDLPQEPFDVDDADVAYRTQIEQFEATHGNGYTELNALEADLNLYQRIVRDGIEHYRDHKLANRVSVARDRYRKACKKAVRDAVAESGIHDHFDAITEWIQAVDEMADEYVDEFDAFRDAFDQDLDELKGDPAYTTFTTVNAQIRELVEVPSLDVHIPNSEISPPDDPLYTTTRGYAETLERAKRGSDDESGGEQQ